MQNGEILLHLAQHQVELSRLEVTNYVGGVHGTRSTSRVLAKDPVTAVMVPMGSATCTS
jgi:hypothetical protein